MGQHLTSGCDITHTDHTGHSWRDYLQWRTGQCFDCTLQNITVSRTCTWLRENDRKWFAISTLWPLGLSTRVGGHSVLCVVWMRPTSQSCSERLFRAEGTFSSTRLQCVRQHEQRLLWERKSQIDRPHKDIEWQDGKWETGVNIHSHWFNLL